ncbi:MAG: recombinase family protein [Clostridia bacterium]|nr:recombinase family protein [Clostridia bacterium]
MLLRKEERPVNEPQRVIVIEPTAPPETRKLRVAAYVRVSSDSADQLNSFMAQANYYTTLIADKEHWELADLYADESVTGTSAEKRPEFQRMLEDCRQGRVDKILTKSVSRFARNAKECLETVRELKALGISVHFEEQGIDSAKVTGELLTSIFAALAQTESESISGNMRWSYQKRMQAGTFIPPVLPYGYAREGNRIVIDEERAAVVRRIFRDYLSGVSTEALAQQLSAERVPCRYGDTRWSANAVRYILSNEKYAGDSLWQKYYTTDTLPYRCRLNKGERQAYFAESTHPPILPRDVVQAAQRLLSERQTAIPEKRHDDQVFCRRIHCGHCGNLFRRNPRGHAVYWACIGHERRAEVDCSVTQIPETAIQEAFLRLYHRLRWHGGAILTQLIDRLNAVREEQMFGNEPLLALNKQILDLKDQLHMLAEMHRSGLIDADLFLSQNNLTAVQLSKAKDEKRKLLATARDDTVEKTETLLELLESLPDFLPDFDREVFADLVDHITVVNNTELRFRLINGLELTESIERTTRR